MTTRHEFLEQLHELLKPERYLEVGVQHGWSLQLSKARISIGIDPNPLIDTRTTFSRTGDQYVLIQKMTSDEYFADEHIIVENLAGHKIDLAFIDGMHLVENALRDFRNIEEYCHDRSVIVFDDVLPTTIEMAAREQCPGDWTGDVWRVYDILRESRPDLVLMLVNTQPTGLLVVLKPDSDMGPKYMDASLMYEYDYDHSRKLRTYSQIGLHQAVLDRRHALDPDLAFEQIMRWRSK